jgi:predicted transcriptional regulator
MNRSNRSKHEIVSDILMVIDADGATIYEMQFKTGISYQHLKKYLTYLVQNELIVYNKEKKKFRMTQRGILAANVYSKMDDLLSRKTRINMTKAIGYIIAFP